MSCKFASFIKSPCFGNVLRIDSLSTEEAESVLTENGFLLSAITANFDICDSHLREIRDSIKTKRSRYFRCCVPETISFHKTIRQSGNRKITPDILRRIHSATGVVVPLGAPICTACRKSLTSKKDDGNVESENVEPVTVEAEQVHHSHTPVPESYSTENPETDTLTANSDYDSQCQSLSQESAISTCDIGKRDALNTFLSLYNVSPVKEKKVPLRFSCEKSEDNCIQKALQCMGALCDTICPGEGGLLEQKLKTVVYNQIKENEKMPLFDETVFILKEVYLNAATWSMQRQILSIIAKDRSFSDVKKLIPDVSFWKYTQAKNHCVDVGCGMFLTPVNSTRQKLSTEKLEHFIDFIVSSDIVKDLPYGSKTMKLSTGQIVEVPNLIRSLAPSSLINRYKQICDAQDIIPIGTSTLYKILNDCSASVRKCIEGLDYYVAEGGRSFQEMEEVIYKLPIGEERMKSLASRLLSAKSYLKTDYKIHIKEQSETADHCRQFSLGYNCTDHSHGEVCEQCENVEDVLREISTLVHDSSWENKDSMMFQVDAATENIQNWKKHIVRSRNQEEARLDIVRELQEGTMLVTSDWAMKILPRKYREGQTDWFAKRGMNWHITVTVFKKDDAIKNITHVHIFSSQVSQDAATTVSLIKDTVEDLQNIYTDIDRLHFFSDNAGCYKNTLMMSIIKNELGDKVASYNFSESQDGKGPCDRRASHIKSAIKRYINEGHNVTTAEEMKKAIDAKQNGQFRVKVVDTVTNVETLDKQLKGIPNISQYFNFVFEEAGLRVYKAYKVGKGELIPWNTIGRYPKSVEILEIMGWTQSSAERSCSTSDDANSSAPKKRKLERYDCDKEGCTRSFSSNKALETHLLLGDCDISQDMTLHDQAKSLYGSKVNELFINSNSVTLASTTKEGHSDLQQGWALKGKKKRVTFSDEQKQFLKEKFYNGKRTGSKVDPYKVSLEMRNLKVDGVFVFSKLEYLTVQQITSFFSRLSLKDRQLDIEDYRPADLERCKEELKMDILSYMK